MPGYFRQALDRQSRAELLALIKDYGGGHVPLVVPLTLFALRACNKTADALVEEWIDPEKNQKHFRDEYVAVLDRTGTDPYFYRLAPAWDGVVRNVLQGFQKGA